MEEAQQPGRQHEQPGQYGPAARSDGRMPPAAPLAHNGYQPSSPAQYRQPVPDMGSTLGYGQGMGYQYYNQPSQPLPVLRQARLQQLREERMRRQQRRMQPAETGMFTRKLLNRLAQYGAASPARRAQPPYASARPPAAAAPSAFPEGVPAAGPSLVSAPAQDTGMIQRGRIQRATMILTAAFIFSDVLGLGRTVMLTSVLGTTGISDAFFQAFLIPDTIFNTIAGGALASAFIPVFTKYVAGDNDEQTAWHVASAALNLAIALMIVLALLAIIFAGQIIPLYNPQPLHMSAHDYSAHIGLIVALARIMLLQAILLGAGVIVTSILQAKEQFLLPAIGSALYNVGIIVGLLPGLVLLLIGHPDSTVAVYGATWGVVIGAALQVAIPLPGLIKAGMRYSFTFDWRHPGIIQIVRQMVPRIINSGMLSFSTGVDRYLISSLGLLFSATVVAGLVTQYAQAFQLLLLPWSIFGATFATAAFPALAENIARNRLDRFRGTVMETLRSILFLAIPSSIGLIVLGLTIIQLLFEHGAFTYDDAARTVYPLAGFAVGLAGLSTVEILTRSFYALRDSRTPVTVSVVQFIFKIALSLLLISFAAFGPGWGIAALALSTSVATTLEAGVLLLLLQRRIGGFELRQLGRFIVQVLLVAGVMGICILISRLLLDLILPTVPAQGDTGLGIFGTLKALIKLAIEVFAGLFVYLRGARLIGLEESEPVKRVLRRFRLSWI